MENNFRKLNFGGIRNEEKAKKQRDEKKSRAQNAANLKEGAQFLKRPEPLNSRHQNS